MDSKKFILAVVVGYVLLAALGYLIHGIWLQPVYKEYDFLWRAQDWMMKKRWVMWVGQLLFTVIFAYIYTRGVENKPWIGQGIRFGVMMTLLAVVPVACTEYTVHPIPYTLAVKWMIAGGLQLTVLGLVVAWFLKKPSTA